MDEFERLRELLEKTYEFPASYPHKFIGRNSEAFREAIAELEKKFEGLRLISRKLSANENHLAVTFALEARDAEHVIDLMKHTHRIPDVIYVL